MKLPTSGIVGHLDYGREHLETLFILGRRRGLRLTEVHARHYVVLYIEVLFKQTGLCLEAFGSDYIVVGY